MREPLEIASADGRCRLVLTATGLHHEGAPLAGFAARLELGGLRAEVQVEAPETETLLSLFQQDALDASPGEWQSFGGEIALSITSAGLEVELWHAFGPAWSASGVIPLGREELAQRAADVARFLS